jgi:hypothetical protein
MRYIQSRGLVMDQLYTDPGVKGLFMNARAPWRTGGMIMLFSLFVIPAEFSPVEGRFFDSRIVRFSIRIHFCAQ